MNEFVQNWADFTGENLVTYDGLDEAIVGIVRSFNSPTKVTYSFTKIIDILMAQGMDAEEAIDYFGFNIEGLGRIGAEVAMVAGLAGLFEIFEQLEFPFPDRASRALHPVIAVVRKMPKDRAAFKTGLG